MGKLNPKIDNRIAWAVIAAAVCFAIALPALAGTMYSWRTLDGSQAFTDDPKRIPARYRDEAERRPMGHLEDYSRYTPSQVGTKEPYGERLERRLEHLRAANRPEATAVAPERLRLGVSVGKDHISLPIGEGEGPTVVESVRIDGAGITTRHATVIRKGDRVIAVRKAEENNFPPKPREVDPEE